MNLRIVFSVLFALSCANEPHASSAVAERVVHNIPAYQPPEDFKALRFGMLPYMSPGPMIAAHQKLAQRIQETIHVPVELLVGATYSDLTERLKRGEFDLVELSPFAYVRVSQEVKLNCLVQSIADGSATSSGYLFVREDSRLHSLSDIKGSRLALVEPMSTSGSLLPKKFLKQKGFDLERDFLSIDYLGHHDNVISAVLEGRADVGATFQGSFSLYRRAHGVDPLTFRVIAKTQRTPRDIYCVRADLPEAAAQTIRATMLSLTSRDKAGREVLGPLNANGFQPANDSSFDVIRQIAGELSALDGGH